MTITAWYGVAFGLSFLLTAVLTTAVRRLAIRYQIVDRPDRAPERKIHQGQTPLLGGAAVFGGFIIATLIVAFSSGQLIGDGMPWKYIAGIASGGLLIIIGGILDDRHSLPAAKQFIWPLLAAVTVIAAGVGIEFITNPWGGVINLHQFTVAVLTIGEVVFEITLWADLFALVWMLGMMYTTKFLDGLDGLVSGITAVGCVFIFIVSVLPDVQQPGTAMLAALLAGSAVGFLLFNWHPAKIFLGEGGSIWLGFMLGILSIIAGSKIATALLIMGIPILDVVWVIGRRLIVERHSPFVGDKKHLHFRLLDAGFSHRKSVIFLLFLGSVFGLAGLFVTGADKALTLGILLLVMVLLAGGLVFVYRLKHPKLLPPLDKIDK